jgi:hypothetical protein
MAKHQTMLQHVCTKSLLSASGTCKTPSIRAAKGRRPRRPPGRLGLIRSGDQVNRPEQALLPRGAAPHPFALPVECLCLLVYGSLWIASAADPSPRGFHEFKLKCEHENSGHEDYIERLIVTMREGLARTVNRGESRSRGRRRAWPGSSPRARRRPPRGSPAS